MARYPDVGVPESVNIVNSSVEALDLSSPSRLTQNSIITLFQGVVPEFLTTQVLTMDKPTLFAASLSLTAMSDGAIMARTPPLSSRLGAVSINTKGERFP